MRLVAEPLTDDVILAAVRENARVASTMSGPTDPDPRSVIIYHQVRGVIAGLAMGNVRTFAEMNGVTPDEVAAVERHRNAIIAADPHLARMVASIEARRSARAMQEPKAKTVKKRAPRAEPEEPVPSGTPVIGYSTPKGKPQVIRAKTVTQAWERLERFLATCTDADPFAPLSATLTFMETAEIMARPGVGAALDRAREMLGPSRPMAWAGLGVVMPELAGIASGGLVTGGVQHTWSVPAGQFRVALNLIRAGDPWPRELMPVASLMVLHRFGWRGTGSASEASGESRCFTHLSARSTMNPMFIFPFESAGGEFLSFLARIKGIVPIALSAKNFRLLQPTKTAGYVPRLIDTSEIDRALRGKGGAR